MKPKRFTKTMFRTVGLFLLAALLVALACALGAPTQPARVASAAPTANGFASLPPDAQSAIMRVLAQQDEMYARNAGAQRPLAAEPWIQQAKLTISDGAANDQFGNSVSISGDTIVVGAHGPAGPTHNSAHVFVKPVSGWATTSTFTSKLTTGAGNWGFGRSVSISGDTIAVGAPDMPISGKGQQGAAYVFVKPVSGWATTSTPVAELTVSDGVANDRFGDSISINGDTVVVGATGVNGSQGAAYVFVKPVSGWATTSTFTAKLTASDGAANDKFGYSVSISDDTVVVGVMGVNSSQGAAYVFVKPTNGWATTSTPTSKLAASDGATNDNFGYSASISGDTVVVGAYRAKIGSNDLQGATYVFVKPTNGWAAAPNPMNQTAKLTASDGGSWDWFGTSVSIEGNMLVVGAQDAAFGGTKKGAVYAFVKPVSGWVTTSTFNAKLAASDGAELDHFGISTCYSGNTIVVGADWVDVGSNANQGAAYVFGIYHLYLPLILR